MSHEHKHNHDHGAGPERKELHGRGHGSGHGHGAHDHAHGGHGHSHNDFAALRKKSKGAMIAVLCLTFTFMAVEVVGGLLTGSLALLADAGHMLGDSAAILLALLAVWFAGRKPSKDKTYGYYRTEILAALFNGVVLIGLSLYILFEAFQRFTNPSEILSGPMLLVAIGGLVVNLIAARLLHSHSGDSLNAKAAYLEVMSDLLGSAAVIVASLIIMYTGWTIVDPIVSGLIGLMIIPRTWKLIGDCVHILMEGTPSRVNLEKLRASILKVRGVMDVHDLHVWTITSGRDALSAHVVVDQNANSDRVLTEITHIVQHDFELHHSTLQIEQAECKSLDGICIDTAAGES